MKKRTKKIYTNFNIASSFEEPNNNETLFDVCIVDSSFMIYCLLCRRNAVLLL